MSSKCKDEQCNDGLIHFYFKNEKIKSITNDWSYCDICYPGNTCDINATGGLNWEAIDVSEYMELEKQGYNYTEV